MHGEIETCLIARKNQPPNVHGRHQTVAKIEKELETLIQELRIYRKMCHTNKEKRKTT